MTNYVLNDAGDAFALLPTRLRGLVTNVGARRGVDREPPLIVECAP